jgi:hypothetical protein
VQAGNDGLVIMANGVKYQQRSERWCFADSSGAGR